MTAASTDAGSSEVHSASVVCPVLSMRMSLAMEESYARGHLTKRPLGPRADRSDAQLVADEPLDGPTVRATLRLAHHGAHQRADRLRVASADARDDVRVLLEHARHDRLQLAVGAHRGQTLALDHRIGL